MRQTMISRICVAAATLAVACGQVAAQPHRYHRHVHRVVAVVPKPVVAVHVNNRFTQKERFAMLMAYLDSHKYITSRQYAKLTGLKKRTAEAELDAFARDAARPIRLVLDGKKKLYTKK